MLKHRKKRKLLVILHGIWDDRRTWHAMPQQERIPGRFARRQLSAPAPRLSFVGANLVFAHLFRCGGRPRPPGDRRAYCHAPLRRTDISRRQIPRFAPLGKARARFIVPLRRTDGHTSARKQTGASPCAPTKDVSFWTPRLRGRPESL
jgi:hypothetical protein